MAETNGADLVCTRLATDPDNSRRACAHCGAPFSLRPRSRRDARFCQPACRARWHAAKRADLLAELERALTRAVEIVRELRERY